ncbi:hypothetical protein [Duganella sp. Root198D2]|uniref:hypothetical protein n=1 Tax=Duganella sp. Root198D2 TaxID=1736489 RepID=UPI00070D5832|nr:hypothetical protein [Duganella sp. Root198D2]KRB92539.1 hypothetical protein ASE26_06140 [Duganella sp. Root198D2]
MNKLIRLIFFALLASVDARAGDCPFTPKADSSGATQWNEALRRLSMQNCAGDPNEDLAELVRAYEGFTKDAKGEGDAPQAVAKGVTASLDLLAGFASGKAGGSANTEQWRAMRDEIRASQAKAIAVYVASPSMIMAPGDTIVSNRWNDFPASALQLNGVKITPLAPLECPAATCPGFGDRVDMLRVIRIMSNLGAYANSDWLKKNVAIAERERRRWESYRADGHHQYIWEVVVNGYAMKGSHCTRKENASKERIYLGFCEVPTAQWIVLHPDAALRWSHSAEQSSDLKPAFIIEALGRYWWRWGGESGATMLDRRGVALATSYSDYRGEKRWSYGPMLHYDSYSLAITKAAGGRWGLVLNIGLAGKIFDVKGRLEDLP